MGLVDFVDVGPQKGLAINSQVNEFPVTVGEIVDEFKWRRVLDTCVTSSSGHVVFVISGKDVVSFGPELEDYQLPGLLQIHAPEWFSSFFVDGDEVINNIGFPSAIVVYNSMIQSTGLEILSEHQGFKL